MSALAAMAAAEQAGLVIGRDIDVVGKEATPLLSRLRRDSLVVRETVSRAGDFLAKAVIAAIDKRTGCAVSQGLEVPEAVVSG